MIIYEPNKSDKEKAIHYLENHLYYLSYKIVLLRHRLEYEKKEYELFNELRDYKPHSNKLIDIEKDISKLTELWQYENRKKEQLLSEIGMD